MLAVIGPSMNEYRGPPAFLFRSCSKLPSRSHRSSTPCSTSGRSKEDPTGVKRIFSFVAATCSPFGRLCGLCQDTKKPPRSRDGAAVVPPELARLRAPTLRFAIGVALRLGLAALRLSSSGIGVDRPSNACRCESTRETVAHHLVRTSERSGAVARVTIMILDLYMFDRYT